MTRLRSASALRLVVTAVAVTTLAGCAELGLLPATVAGPANACCTPWSALPYAPLEVDTELSPRVGATSPVVEQPTGRSAVVALRLPDGPRPLVLDLASRRIPPGDDRGSIAAWGARVVADVMAPTIWVLDARHAVVRTITPERVTEECHRQVLDGNAPLFHVHATIDETPERSTYLVIGTTDVQRAAGTPSRCSGVKLRFGNLGQFDLALWRPLPAEPDAIATSANWAPDADSAPALTAHRR